MYCADAGRRYCAIRAAEIRDESQIVQLMLGIAKTVGAAAPR